MLAQLKNFIRQMLPTSLYKALAPLYHGTIAHLANIYFGHPARELSLIGVTGTAGKSTTVIMMAHILNQTGHRTGYITTVSSFDGRTETINEHGLSMPGPWLLQKTLHNFAARGCKFAIIEATSEGLAQNRHLGMKFDAALFTNLTPAHLDSHGGFENYRQAKGRLFRELKSSGFSGVNTDDPNFHFFADFPARKKFGVSTRNDKTTQTAMPILRAENIIVDDELHFEVSKVKFDISLKGSFNITNALLAIGAVEILGVPLKESSAALKNFGTIRGRMEAVPNDRELTIIIDYAPEPAGMEQALRAAQLVPHQRLIHVFGSTGGHRDTAKRFEFGKISAQFADTIIITNDDVYDSEPAAIAADIKAGIEQAGNKKTASEILTVLDRREAIGQALELAEPQDLILLTGKGSEQFLVLPGNKRIPWDEKKLIEELLGN
ncbi:MAG TPA: UDP-N-acetylmuramoyl-L-alanyl-D-glutamate--2,6-diaminopimelate ligase [Candidatus Doudnabacteria bacterium]|nr:UDP-N-acetylmuramoyl-L-alanyl-D-glutamate--2,6-diaminopimelate ligase [Candidatus Doudnabacteria bacterium]